MKSMFKASALVLAIGAVFSGQAYAATDTGALDITVTVPIICGVGVTAVGAAFDTAADYSAPTHTATIAQVKVDGISTGIADLQWECNDATYTLKAESTNYGIGGAVALSNGAEEIAYTLIAATAGPADLTGGANLVASSGASGEVTDTLTLAIAQGELDGKTAGDYTDTITFTLTYGGL